MQVGPAVRPHSSTTVGSDVDRPRVLVIQHQDNCPPALFGGWLRAKGLDLDVRRPDRGETLPSDLVEHSALLVLGGAMGAHDDARFRWLTATKDLLHQAVARRIATLGICLGHQLAAVALGGRSEPNSNGQTVGVRPIGWRAAAERDLLFAELAYARGALVPHWNGDVVTRLPPGTTLLAATDDGAPQVIRLGDRAWGVQFHPEADHIGVGRWAEEDRDDAVRRDIDVDAALQQIKEAEPRVHDTGRAVANAFAQVVRNGR